MEDFQSPTFNSYNKGVGKEIKDSADDNDKNFHLYVVGIPPDFTPKGLTNLYSVCGIVQKCSLLAPKQPGWPKVGFVEFKTMPEVLKALEMYKEFPIGDYTIKTSIAKKREDRAMKITAESLKDVDLGELVEESIQQTAKRAEKRFEKFKDQKKKQEEEQGESMKKPCVVCSKLCLSTCGQCKTVSYCGSTCQRDDWKEHKMVCIPVEKKSNVISENYQKSLSANEASDSGSTGSLMIEIDNILVKSVESHVKSIAKSIEHVPENTAHSIERASTKNIPPFPSCVSIDSTISAILVDVQLGTGIFYFQIVQNNDSLQALDHMVNQYYSQGNGIMSTLVQTGGSYACQFSIDQRWYRVVVQDFNDDNSVCNIWYVDYGNYEDVPTEKLLKLENDFLIPSPYSLRAKLYGCNDIRAINITQLIGEHLKDPNVELVIKSMKGSLVEVEMFFELAGVKTALNKSLMEKYLPGLKLPSSPSNFVLESPEKLSKSIIKHETEELKLESHSQQKNPTMLCDTENVELRNSTTKNQVSSTLTKSNLSSIFKKISIKTVKQEEIFDETIKEAEFPNGKFDAVLTNVESIEDIAMIGSQQEALAKMNADLSAYCEKNYTQEPFKQGKICAAKYSVGAEWYRAEMLSQNDSNEASVYFFDFGNKETVSLDKICKMPRDKNFWEFQKQSKTCKLKDCSLGNDIFNEKSLELLKQCVNQVITVEIDKSSDTPPVPVTIYIDESTTVNEYLSQLKTEMNVVENLVVETTVPLVETVEVKEAAETESEKVVLGSILDGIEKGYNVEILITYVESPGDFICQVYAENQLEMNDLTSKMSQVYENLSPSSCEINSCNLYAVKYHIDSMWYRARIVGDINSDNAFDVVFLDYGNKEKVQKDDIKLLLTEFQYVPIQGIKCRLGGCVPDKNDNWSEDSISAMRNLCNQKFSAVFLDIINEEAIVDVFFDEEHSVAGELIAAGLIAASQSKEQSTPIVSEEHMLKSDNTPTQTTSISDDVTTVAVETDDDLQEEKNDSKTHNLSDADLPSLDGMVSSEPSSESDPVSLKSADVSPPKIPPVSIDTVKPVLGEVQPAGIVHVNTPGSFYCQLLSDDMPEIVQSLEELNIKCSQDSGLKETFEVGDFCVACASDGRWYRSQIITVDRDNMKCMVHYLDYGDDDTVPHEKIQKMSSEFASIKIQALHCKLTDCVSTGEKWTAESIDTIKTLTEQVCQIKFYTTEQGVHVVDVFLTDDLTLSKYMIQNGFATLEKTEDVRIDNEKQKDAVVESNEEPVKVERITEDLKECIIKEGDFVSVRLQKATSPCDMVAKIMKSENTEFSINCKLADVQPITEKWSEEASNVLMMFASHDLEAKIISSEICEEGKMYLTRIPTFVNALILAGEAVYCM